MEKTYFEKKMSQNLFDKEKARQEVSKIKKLLIKHESLYSSFDYIQLSIASPDRILSWAKREIFLETSKKKYLLGEVTNYETLKFTDFSPISGGLFCERVFGPLKTLSCSCGNHYENFGFACPRCFVEFTDARVRRYRMGVFKLALPVAHTWFLRSRPSYMEQLLGVPRKVLETILYYKEPFQSFRGIEQKKKYGKNSYSFDKLLKNKKVSKRSNSEIIYSLLEDIDLCEEIAIIREHLSNISIKSKASVRLVKRLRILESFYSTATMPTSLMLTYLPILPPTLRPLQELENGKIISADLNEIYRLIILRTRRIFPYNPFEAKDSAFLFFYSQGPKMVQEIVDSLIDNARIPKKQQILLNGRPLKTLTEILEGKEGRFRQTLLGKRVDYSGRSVIVVGPELKMNQCGLPFAMAKILFEPFLIALLLELKINLEERKLSKASYASNVEIYRSIAYKKFLRLIIQKNKPLIWLLLFKLSEDYSILLNRAPTLHKFGIQAFDPLIILGEAIQLHPLVCTGFNADFDGDQMAVHLPVYSASQLEIKSFLKSTTNVLSPSNGEVILKPSQDIVIGTYYLTFLREKRKNEFPKIFFNKSQILAALSNKIIELQTPIFVRYSLYNCSFFIEENLLNFSEGSFLLWKERIQIFKILYSSSIRSKAYFLTNRGILTAYKVNDNKYLLSDCFFETTAGRTLFTLGLLNF